MERAKKVISNNHRESFTFCWRFVALRQSTKHFGQSFTSSHWALQPGGPASLHTSTQGVAHGLSIMDLTPYARFIYEYMGSPCYCFNHQFLFNLLSVQLPPMFPALPSNCCRLHTGISLWGQIKVLTNQSLTLSISQRKQYSLLSPLAIQNQTSLNIKCNACSRCRL